MEWWFVEFKVSDSGTGLNRINVNQNSQDVRVPYTNEQILYYRYHFLIYLLITYMGVFGLSFVTR